MNTPNNNIDYNKIIIELLSLSEAFEKHKNKNNYFLLKPIIVNILSSKDYVEKDEILKYMFNIYKIPENITSSILDYYISTEKIITYEKKNKTYTIISKNENNLDDIQASVNQWNSIIQSANTFISNKSNNISINIDEHFYNFFISIFGGNNVLKQANNVNRDIAIFISKCYTKNKCYTNTFLNIIKGIAIIQGVSNSRSSSFVNKKKPRIYVDNILLKNLLGWHDETSHLSSLLLLDTLNELGFEINMHDITFSTIVELINKYQSRDRKNTDRNYLYNIRHNCITKTNFSIDKLTTNLFGSELEDEFKKYNIKEKIDIENKVRIVDENSPLFLAIHKHRKDSNIGKGFYAPANEQTYYDYKILKYYNEQDIKQSDDIEKINSIYMTYLSAITNNRGYSPNKIYSKIMHVNEISSILLIESIISGLNDVSNSIATSLLLKQNNNILEPEIERLVEKAQKDLSIPNDIKHKYIALACSTLHQGDVLEAGENPDFRSFIKKYDNNEIELKKNKKKLKKTRTVNENQNQKLQEINQINKKLEEKVSKDKALIDDSENFRKNLSKLHSKNNEEKDKLPSLETENELIKTNYEKSKIIFYGSLFSSIILIVMACIFALIENTKSETLVWSNFILPIILTFIAVVCAPIALFNLKKIDSYKNEIKENGDEIKTCNESIKKITKEIEDMINEPNIK